MREKYSKKELKQMLKTKCCPVDAPSEIQQKIDRQRIKFNREALSTQELMDKDMEEHDARVYRVVKKPTWVSRFRRTLLGRGTAGRASRFGVWAAKLFNR